MCERLRISAHWRKARNNEFRGQTTIVSIDSGEVWGLVEVRYFYDREPMFVGLSTVRGRKSIRLHQTVKEGYNIFEKFFY